MVTNRSKILVALALILLLGGLGAADYFYGGDLSGQVTDAGSEPPEGGVAPNAGPVIEDEIAASGMTTQTSDELTLLRQLMRDGTPVMSLVLLKDGDRAGSVSWTETPQVKEYFTSLKDALLTSFSPQMRDLRDETIQEEGKPVRNLLTFFDPVLSEERIVFVRVRQRLYEFHVAEGKDEVMNAFIEGLTTK